MLDAAAVWFGFIVGVAVCVFAAGDVLVPVGFAAEAVVVVAAGAIAVPKFQNTKGKAYVASMKSDLRNLSVAEEGYFYEHRVYTSSLDSLSFSPSNGVILNITQAGATGWAATTTGYAAGAPPTARLGLGEAAGDGGDVEVTVTPVGGDPAVVTVPVGGWGSLTGC